MNVEPDRFKIDEYDSIFGIGYFYLLQPDEGIVVEYNSELFVIWRSVMDNTVKIQKASDLEICSDSPPYDGLEPGTMLWMYTDNEN